ncbi:hypothetical protein FACS1894216_08990 [Synergistales bacterium]|nr:hypothetical protein FACS1894216_08990 [Synergistales bacterium]
MRKKRVISVTLLAFTIFAAACGASSAAISEEQVRHAWADVCRIVEMEALPLSIKEDKAPNAWVESGKSVTVTTALMEMLVNENEIFGVLSHEAGHAALGHYEGRVQNAVGVNVLAVLLGKAIGDNVIGNVVVGAGAQLATSGYSREQEVAADDFAVDTAFKGGMSPTGIYTSLARLANYNKTEPSGFNSHPPDERRLRHVKDRILARAPETVFPTIDALGAKDALDAKSGDVKSKDANK